MKHSQIFPTDIFQWKDILTPQEFESVRNVVQFDKADVDIPLLKRFIANTAMPELMQVKGIDPKYTVEITEMWGNVLQPGDDHQYHSHPNNVFSGIFYLTEGTPTIFCDPRPAANVLRLIHPYNLNTGTKTVLFAVPNQMVMFDSWLPHYVGVNKEQSARKTISFNIIFRGEYGHKGSKANVVI
jgi:hypothetical protein